MIILFHMVYAIASSLVNIITHSFYTAKNVRKVSDIVKDDEQIITSHKNRSSVSDVYVKSCNTQVSMATGLELDPGLGLCSTGDCSFVQNFDNCPEERLGLSVTPSEKLATPLEQEDVDADFRPFPPVYAQRYLAVKDVLSDEKWNGQMKKIIDFGCNDLTFFQYIKNMKGVEEVLLVDIDEGLLKQISCRVAPLNCDFLGSRQNRLLVQVFGGSIAEQDSRLIGTDAVICIELIEHLWPDEVEAVPYTVFGFIFPKVAIFTTPNADFNVVFKNFSGFRHPDHKFEWTREQFECWANNIVLRYPAYEVTFHGIGPGRPGTEVYGCCSQMAVFVRNSSNIPPVEIQPGEVYKLICSYDYPFREDKRTNEEKILHEAEYYLHHYSKNETYCLENGSIEIPLVILLPYVEAWCDTIDDLRKILISAGWTMSSQNTDFPSVVYPYYYSHTSSESEDQEQENLFQGQENIVDENYLHPAEDWDDCPIDPKLWDETAVGSSSTPPQVNSWNALEIEGGYMPLESTEATNLPVCSMSSVVLHENCKELQEANRETILNSHQDRVTNYSAIHVNGKEQNNATSSCNCTVESPSVLSSASEEKVHVGTLFQSNKNNTISEPDSAILLAGSSVKSLDDITLSMVAQTTDFLTNSVLKSGCRSSHECREVPPQHSEVNIGSVNSVLSTNRENDSGSCELNRQTHSITDSSRSFFLDLLSSEREAHNAGPANVASQVENVHSISEQRMDLDQSPEPEEDNESLDSDDSQSGHSQDAYPIDNRALPRRAQPHRNHFPFGLNDVVVENGDVANNNRDGEGNNAVPLDDVIMDDDDDDDLLDDEVGDHEEDDDDFDNANDLILPDNADPFPPWLLQLLQVANEDGIELGAAGEPHIFLGDL